MAAVFLKSQSSIDYLLRRKGLAQVIAAKDVLKPKKLHSTRYATNNELDTDITAQE